MAIHELTLDTKRVKNLGTGEVFNSVNEAAKAYSVSNVTISKSCKSNGKIAVGSNKGKKYRWCFKLREEELYARI